MKVNEIFSSIQGEGRYAGYPALFIRLSGCTRNCNFCDTKYHTKGIDTSVEELVDVIKKSRQSIIVWTGGEPTIQLEEINDVIKLFPEYMRHHLETNGDIIVNYSSFDYVCFSPKDIITLKNVLNNIKLQTLLSSCYDIKVVTDGIMSLDLCQDATMLMPLTTYDAEKDKLIKQTVWSLCVNMKKKFCLRQHVEVWNKKVGI